MQARTSDHMSMGRRRLLGLSLAAGASTVMPTVCQAALQLDAPRILHFYNLHTKESLSALYWRDGGYVSQGLADISYHLRDFRSGGLITMDPRLLDLLHVLVAEIDYFSPINVISGYRTPATNAMLAARSEKVALNSYHTRGQAVDIRLPGKKTTYVRDAALALALGGVGYYPESDFVHMDTGPVRAW